MNIYLVVRNDGADMMSMILLFVWQQQRKMQGKCAQMEKNIRKMPGTGAGPAQTMLPLHYWERL